ncbi:sensor histidine kinase [Paenibacillus paeoniae]|uniref:Signal transduction histidine-protein kinase ArlS n=1 Tax=Paenibacillus paeoniae TaxID=2292705 RepID=A0A371PJ71_9BACL|nr:HAMP domain-containing histidine kinase [Paenibacillus paeoniae]REK75699.1 sensor histidine kinase [Paenibacillus paeoniae]
MSRIGQFYSRVPIHWKLTIWASLLLCALFATSNLIQFVFVDKWMAGQEQRRMEQDMKELLNLLLSKEVRIGEGDHTDIRHYLERANRRDGMIRILTDGGVPLIVTADNMPPAVVQADLMPDSRMGTHYADGMLISRSPITIFDFQGTVEIARSVEDMEQLIAAFYRIMIICCLVAIMVSVLGGRLVARQLIKPLRSMNETIRKVKQNGLQERMTPVVAKDDISALKMMFNEMMDEVERSFLQQKQFVEDASHELRTPIAVLEGHLALLQRWGKHNPEVLDESLRISMEELSRLKKLVEELLTLSRAEKLEPSVADMRCETPVELLSSVAGKMGIAHPSFTFKLEAEAMEGVSLAISDSHLEGVLRIVLDNAVKYSGHCQEVSVYAELHGEEAVISIVDKGIGIQDKDLPFIWDRFYQADKSRSGSSHGYGLGLSIAKRMMQSVGGAISLANHPDGGTVATLMIPILPEKD